MKNIIQFIMVILLGSVALHTSCYDKYKCQPKSEIDTETKQKIYTLKNCTLPNMPTFPITAPDVFNLDEEGQPSTLKKYFETNNDVCDVLRWFNDEIPYMQSHYPKFSETIKKPLALTFFS